ncbi:hypothetical protein WA1_24155 [Scytonema hofmannii PCC 7110]|uniref:DUF4007 domain-containing protein n=1 Tax=Scytonema hofmannii PCC 7110 TaxID=128403 RepID=A0A139X7T0_9CYAN|nr:DUF4007 family protein [Scytonema hofmannii]KYC40736.1 hypothetical protein WA1_24155 [Scytonema hofmannii PCC 7110]
MPRLQLSFHTTFALKKEDLLKILCTAAEEQGLKDTIENLMERTSLGNKKVAPMKSWAMRAGLVRDNYLSPEGKIVLEKDPYLKSTITDWLMHFYLSFGDKGLAKPPDNPSDWGGWSYFVYSFLPELPTFTLNELVQCSAVIFEQDSEKRLMENFTIVLKAYALSPNKNTKEESPLKYCQFLTLDEDTYTTRNATLPNPYLIGYFLAKLWERDFGDTTSVLTDDLLQQKMGLAPILGIETEALQECLNQLETLAIIEQRRTVSPAQIIRRWTDPLALLEKAYADG